MPAISINSVTGISINMVELWIGHAVAMDFAQAGFAVSAVE